MINLDQLIGFDWDNGNLEKNKNKHYVEFFESEQIFSNFPLICADIKHSQAESRYYALGETDAGRKLFVVFTIRRQLIRIISARDMSTKERQIYEIKRQKT